MQESRSLSASLSPPLRYLIIKFKDSRTILFPYSFETNMGQKLFEYLIIILRWAEVWALFIPLLVFLTHRKGSSSLFPIQFYLFLGLALNIMITLISNVPFFHEKWGSNHIYYNLHSIVKVAVFGWFIARNLPAFSSNITKLIFIFYGIFIVWNFYSFQSINELSSRVLTIESIILLFLSITWYLYDLQGDQKDGNHKEAIFIAIAGLCIYEAISFFIFLFYNTLIISSVRFATNIWKVHDIGFIILCLFLVKAFYKVRKRAELLIGRTGTQ